MKPVFLCIFLLVDTVLAYCQNNIRLTNAIQTTSADNRWDLDRYVWSHTHPQHVKNDKPILDFVAIDNWVSLSEQGTVISPNGAYIVYGIQNNLKRRLDSVIIQSTVNNWRAVLRPGAQGGFFSADSRQYIFKDEEGLCLLLTDSCIRRYEKNIESYKIDKKKEWLAFRLYNSDSSMVLLNLITGKEKRVDEVVDYNFDWTGGWLAYQEKDKQVVLQNLSSGKEVVFYNLTNYSFDESSSWFVGKSDGLTKDLILYNLKDARLQTYSGVKSWQFFSTGDYMLLHTEKGLDYVSINEAKRTTIWSTNDIKTSITGERFNVTGKQVVFVTGIGADKAIWHWKDGMDKAELKVNNQTTGIGKDVLIQDGVNFTDNSRYIQVTIQPIIADLGNPAPGAIQLDIWDYQDKILQSTQPYLKETKTCSAIINLETGKLMFKENGNEKLDLINGDYLIISKKGTDIHGDRFWEQGYDKDSVWMISLQTGVRRFIPVQRLYKTIWFSPDGKYLVYFDATKKCNFYSYNLRTGILVNISAGVPAWQLGITNFYLRTHDKPSWGSDVILWLDSNRGFLVYDNYGDIWQLDPEGKKPATCITNGYGHTHNILFKLLNLRRDDQSFIGKDTLLLSSFNRKTKWQGFYRKVIGTKGEPELLSMDKCFMQELRDGNMGQYPMKAEMANTWIVNRQSATEAPNYYVTNDFKTFHRLSNLQPHKCYNWLTTELHSFKQLDGTISQGVLYKPENFDPSKKYPLIISFYGALSDQCYHYTAAKYITAADLTEEPAWMVSHGYLVFIPDIYFIKNQWGPSTVNTVDGAVRYLSQLPYVNNKYMGAAGHSNGGIYGYYLLTHSKSFAAMAVGAGTTNYISASLSLNARSHGSNLEWGEIECYGTGLGNLWKNKNSWLDQTSVLSADKVVAPLLQFHCKRDGAPVDQAVQMFTALRRLEKKVWWLQYDNGGHQVTGDDARDWTIRYTQFFDHYLKEAPPPQWMSRGIPYALKGIESRYELDLKGTCGNNCPVCRKK